jgi:hypothetical protein
MRDSTHTKPWQITEDEGPLPAWAWLPISTLPPGYLSGRFLLTITTPTVLLCLPEACLARVAGEE